MSDLRPSPLAPPGSTAGAMPGRVLVIGSGYLAGHIAARLTGLGVETVLSSRSAPVLPESRGMRWARVDVTSRPQVAALMEAIQPDAVVAVHGPSDITWCEAHPEEAYATHHGGARNIAAALDGRPVLLVSTDNVFPGEAESHGESAQTSPANAYGRAKLAAERELLATSCALVLRVSLVYGWEDRGPRPNFLTSVARSLMRGERLRIPDDHWNTPVSVADVAAWTAALMRSGRTGTLHLGGPRRIGRVDWARRIARQLGADPALIVPTPRAGTAYACRPRNACLHSEVAAQLPELRRHRPVDVLEATHALTF
ncbi:sugar nucleotide-binding protein [Streptomyces sp. SRF1]|uniref:SDR family oxidoreductase n=1 Tax=Streptomyces sp. SRF1 TaxID=1549642 RepID=UPI0025B145BB|nr:sugar nucleotide-binding protein [Streptomyces sp. SRF1]MDN3057217.1 sugar nucleotide-binding protein [Streptomyces sp. SRF1]